MGYPTVNYTWKYKFLIIFILLLILCITEEVETVKNDFTTIIKEVVNIS